MDKKFKLKFKLGYVQLLTLGFILIIFIGALLLSLPISSKDGQFTPFIDALFTSTSASCVTGLVMYDTFTHFTVFGQIVILLLIQTGGLGFFVLIATFSMMLGKKMSARQQNLLKQASGYFKISGVSRMVKVIIIGTIIMEVYGAFLLSLSFIPRFGAAKGIYYSIFHSVSAFCNAGFDLFGSVSGEYSSLTAFADDPYVLIVMASLIFLGGIGFLVWDDFIKYRLNFKKYEFHSKLVLATSLLLVMISSFMFYIFEYDNPGTIGNMSLRDKIINSIFQSVTTRTAGFNSIDQHSLTTSSHVLTNVLMLIGGGPCSTAGGVKTSTIAIVFLNAVSAAQNKKDVIVFQKKIDDKTVKQASSIAMIYLSLVVGAVMIIMPELEANGYDIYSGVYVVCSAIGTVGLARDITAALGILTQIILIMLMFIGRIGGLSIALLFNEKKKEPTIDRPNANVLVG